MIDSEREIRDGIWSTPDDEDNFCPADEAFVELSIACFVPGRGEDGIRDRGEIGVVPARMHRRRRSSGRHCHGEARHATNIGTSWEGCALVGTDWWIIVRVSR